MKRLLVAAMLLGGCSLPLPDGVRTVAGVQAEQEQLGGIQVIPPGPKPGHTPEEVVRGFLRAQANVDDDHAIARSFLTAEAARTWDDTAEVQVYELGPQQVGLDNDPDAPGDRAAVSVRSVLSGVIASDGTYSERSDRTSETYRLQRVNDEWRLSDVPAGLRLTAADRERSFRPANVYYLARATAEATPHLVPQRVFLPVGDGQAEQLVRSALRAPSQNLRGSVIHQAGVTADRVSVDGSGVVTVELSASVLRLSPLERQGLSAQLVWTLRELGPSFTGLRLRSASASLLVPGQGSTQDDGAHDSYDPEGLGPNPPYYFVTSRRLRSSAELPSSTATAGDAGTAPAIAVDGVTVTPDRTQVALLDGLAPGPVTVRTGPLRGPTYRTAVIAPDLRSPSWGSGEVGLWFLQGRRSLVLLPPGGRALRPIPVDGGAPPGSFTALAVSRDGARIALVAGKRLYVGFVQVGASGPRVTGLALLGRDSRVTDVAWASGTEVAVLGLTAGEQPQVQRMAIDGSEVEMLNSSGLLPTQLAASPAGILLTSGARIYRVSSRAPVQVASGTAPVFPG